MKININQIVWAIIIVSIVFSNSFTAFEYILLILVAMIGFTIVSGDKQ